MRSFSHDMSFTVDGEDTEIPRAEDLDIFRGHLKEDNVTISKKTLEDFINKNKISYKLSKKLKIDVDYEIKNNEEARKPVNDFILVWSFSRVGFNSDKSEDIAIRSLDGLQNLVHG